MDVNSTVPPVSTQDSPLPNSIPAEATPAAPTVQQTMASAAPPASPAPSAAPSPIVAQKQAHDNILARGVRALMGHQVGYRVNDKGQEEQYEIHEKPGQLFRHILAGAVLGGAMGGKEKSFGGGVARGYEAEADKEEQMRQERRQVAGEDYKRQLETKKENREQARFESDQKVGEANLAHLQIQTLVEHQLYDHADYTSHQEAAAAGKAWLQGYAEAGVRPAFENVPESKMTELQKNNPNYRDYNWQPTGTVMTKDEKGNATWEFTYSAFDPKAKYKVPESLRSQLEKSGVIEWYPGLGDLLKSGRELDQNQVVSLMSIAKTASNEAYDRQRKGLDLKEIAARTKHENLESAKVGYELAQEKEDKESYDNLTKAGGDISKMSAKSRTLLSRNIGNTIRDLGTALRSEMEGHEPGEPLSEAAQETQKQIEALGKLQTNLLGAGGAVNPPPAAGGTAPKNPGEAKKAALSDPLVNKVVAANNSAGRKIADYGEMRQIPALKTAKNSQLISAAIALDVPIPAVEVERIARESGKTAEDTRALIESEGGKVENSGGENPLLRPESGAERAAAANAAYARSPHKR